MNIEQAEKIMQDGIKMTHRFFETNEWVIMKGQSTLIFEDGITVSSVEFWMSRQEPYWFEDWEIWASN